MVIRKRTYGKLLLVGVCLTAWLFVVGCSSSPLLVPASGQPEMFSVAHPPNLSLAAGDALGTMIVANHPVMLAKQKSDIRLAVNNRPSNY